MTQIQTFTILELATAAGGVAGAVALILKQTQQSRCRNMSCCCGICKCDREIADIENQIENENIEEEKKEQDPPLSPFQPNSIK